MGVSPDRTSVIYPALDYSFWKADQHRPRPLRQELGVEADTFLYLYFGRPGVSKGLEYLIEAAGMVAQARPNSRLVLLLSRSPAKQYQRILEEVSRRGLADHVRVLDPVPREELPGYLLAADCVVVPSISEGFGYAAVEAATLGCRVVATSGHAVEEVLGDGVRLVRPREAMSLAEAILERAHGAEPGRCPPPRFD